MMEFDVDDIKLGSAYAVLGGLVLLVVGAVSGGVYIACRIVWAFL